MIRKDIYRFDLNIVWFPYFIAASINRRFCSFQNNIMSDRFDQRTDLCTVRLNCRFLMYKYLLTQYNNHRFGKLCPLLKVYFFVNLLRLYKNRYMYKSDSVDLHIHQTKHHRGSTHVAHFCYIQNRIEWYISELHKSVILQIRQLFGY